MQFHNSCTPCRCFRNVQNHQNLGAQEHCESKFCIHVAYKSLKLVLHILTIQSKLWRPLKFWTDTFLLGSTRDGNRKPSIHSLGSGRPGTISEYIEFIESVGICWDLSGSAGICWDLLSRCWLLAAVTAIPGAEVLCNDLFIECYPCYPQQILWQSLQVDMWFVQPPWFHGGGLVGSTCRRQTAKWTKHWYILMQITGKRILSSSPNPESAAMGALNA